MSAIGQRLIEIVRAIAAQNPDFIYLSPGGEDASCVYVHCGKPSCLIGHALWDVGLIDSDFARRREQLQWSGVPMLLNEEGLGDVAKVLGLSLDPQERAWLENVQAHQDNGRPWGASVKAADDLTKDDDE